ncbi:MAG: hypothetical protein IKF52_05660 [Clostridia bacterium]|nr:hypothetical protein [Clostridia bacterium]
MKILFAVSNENISNAIVKNYQKKFGDAVTFKNVFYFNAITKELQKDKMYDCVVISEDLEPFANSNYDVIDNFIYGRLESITSYISDFEDRKISIVLICTDRRTKSSSMISKIFDLGIYNALIGSDRKIDEVCKLISNSRTKDEARQYYNIVDDEPGEVGNDDVSELEVQNILIHYKRLGDNEEKYVESFNNIAAQYNDNQLRIIIRYLPIKVKAVLEAECYKYQQLVMNSSQIESDREQKAKEKEKDRRLREKFEQEQKLKDKIAKQEKANKNNLNVIDKKINEQNDTSINILDNKRKEPRISGGVIVPGSIDTKNERKLFSEEEIQNKENNNIKIETVSEKDNSIQSIDDLFDFDDVDTVTPEKSVSNNIVEEVVNIPEEAPKKKGRGRPRKNPIPTEPKPKGKRGRPRKNPLPEEVETIEPEVITELPEALDDDFDIIEPDDTKVNTQNNVGSLPGLDDDDFDFIEPIASETNNAIDEGTLPGFEDDDDLDIISDGGNVVDSSSSSLPGFDDDDDFDDISEIPTSQNNAGIGGYGIGNDISNNSDTVSSYNNIQQRDEIKKIEENKVYSTGSLSSVLTQDKKIAAFIGTSKNGVSFMVNNLAWLFSSIGINTAILDMTKNKNSYYIYTDNNEELRKIAYSSIEKLENGTADGIKVDRNLTVYTAIPNEQPDINNTEAILTTLARNHSLILIDCDYDTDYGIFANSQEIYLVQTMDVLTIQPLTTFLRELKTRGILDPQKLRAVINKEVKVGGVNSKAIIGGMSSYNDPGMSFMTELFNKDKIKACTIPFDQSVYSRYLETMITCKISMNYPKNFINSLKILGNMIYPLMSKQTYGKQAMGYGSNNFSDEMNNTLNQMRKKY